jgi:hypothetical protein
MCNNEHLLYHKNGSYNFSYFWRILRFSTIRNFLVKLNLYLLTKWCISEQFTISRDPLALFCSFWHVAFSTTKNFYME